MLADFFPPSLVCEIFRSWMFHTELIDIGEAISNGKAMCMDYSERRPTNTASRRQQGN